VTLYTTERCSKCVSAKALLQRRGIAFNEVNLARDPDGREALLRRTGMVTFPQIVIGEEVIGGFLELVAADRNGRLTDLVTVEEPAPDGLDDQSGSTPTAISLPRPD
jgi:glutaredoxin 3